MSSFRGDDPCSRMQVSGMSMKHPGKTPAQRRILDAIGCGDYSPYMAKATREKLLSEGLIVELSPDTSHSFGPFPIIIRRFEMPIPVHMQWCRAMSDECEGDEA